MTSRRPFIAWAAMTLLLLVAGQLATAPAAVAQPSSTNPVADVEKSVIQLAQKWEGYVNDGTGWSDPIEVVTVCTGFFVTSTGHAVTAGHCVEPALGRRNLIEQFLSTKYGPNILNTQEGSVEYQRGVANWRVEGFDGGSPPKLTVYALQPSSVEGAVLEQLTIAQVMDFRGSEQGDVALLKIEANNAPPLPVAAQDPANNTAVTSIGFPAAVGAVVDSTSQRADFKSGTVSSHQTSRTGVPMTGINADLSGGMSGGPTVDALGNVLGVNSSGISGEDQNFNFITDTSDLRDWLQGKGLQLLPPNVPPVTPQAQPADPGRSTTPTWMWFALAGAGVALLTGVVLALVLSRRRRNPAMPGMANQPYQPYQPVGQAGWPPQQAPQPWGAGPWGAPPQAPQFGQQTTTPVFGGPPPTRQCSSCGTSLPANNQFCTSCGRPAQ